MLDATTQPTPNDRVALEEHLKGRRMVGTLLGLIVGVGICVQAFNGELEVWSLAALVVVLVIGMVRRDSSELRRY